MNKNSQKILIKDRYNELGARLYDLMYGEEQRAKYREALGIVRVTSGQIALDNGCGTGLFLSELKSIAVGLDLSQVLLREARKRVLLKEEIHLINGDTENLPIRNNVIDITFNFTVLQNTPLPEQMLAESKRVASTEAKHIVTVHKKTMQLEVLRNVIEKSSLKLVKIIDAENIKDWIVLAK